MDASRDETRNDTTPTGASSSQELRIAQTGVPPLSLLRRGTDSP